MRKSIYLFGYNIVSAITAILLRNLFGLNADVRIVTLHKKEENIPSIIESKLIKHILDLNGIAINDFLKQTGGVPLVGSIYKNFKKPDSVMFKTFKHQNENLIKYKKALDPYIKPELLIDYLSEMSMHLKENKVDKDINNNYAFTFDTKKATKYFIEDIFVNKLQGRLLFWGVENIIYRDDGYVNFIQSDLADGLPFTVPLYINCSEHIDLPKLKKRLPYNNSVLTAKFVYTDKPKQINNHKLYLAADNGYILERCLWDRMEISYFYDKDRSKNNEAKALLGNHIMKCYNKAIYDFDKEELYSYDVDKIYNKDIISLRYYDNYVEPLIENRIDNIIKHIFEFADLLQDSVIHSQMYKNYFNKKCSKINYSASMDYLKFLSKTWHKYNGYWSKIYEADINVDLKFDNCFDQLLEHKTSDPEFYKKVWEDKLKYLDKFAEKNIKDTESLYESMREINDDN